MLLGNCFVTNGKCLETIFRKIITRTVARYEVPLGLGLGFVIVQQIVTFTDGVTTIGMRMNGRWKLRIDLLKFSPFFP